MIAAGLLVIASWALAQKPEPPAEQVHAQVQSLSSALDSPRAAERLAALRRADLLAAEAVVRQVERGLGDREIDVRVAALDALGRLPHAAAFESLLAYHTARRKELRTQEVVLPRLLRALARHGDARALTVLRDDVLGQPRAAALRARILGCGQVRAKASVDAVLEILRAIPFTEQVQYLEDMRLALTVLTGVDHGRTLDAWASWWAKERTTFTFPDATPRLSRSDSERWHAYWGTPAVVHGR
jgi:HEAT repeat protein